MLSRSKAVTARDADALARMRELHDRHLGGGSVEPNLISAATSAVAVVGSASDYEVFVGRFKDAATPQEERRYMGALAAFPGEGRCGTLGYVSEWGDPVAGWAVPGGGLFDEQAPWAGGLEFVKSKWDEMLEVYPDNSIVRMVGGIRSLSKPEQAADVKAFFETHSVPTGELTLQQYSSGLM